MKLRTVSRYLAGLSLLGAIFLACDLGSDSLGTSQEDSFEGISGQLESDMDNAILRPDGTVWAWGSNSTGQLGDGTMLPSETPKMIQALRNIVCIDLCEGAAVAAESGGNVWFWGNRLIWEEPPGYDTTVTIPRKISFLSEVKQLVVRGVYIYLLNEDGSVWRLTWDHNVPTKYLHPELVPGLESIVMISGSLALRSDGTVSEFPEDAWVGPEWGGLGDETVSHVSMVQNRSRTHTIVLRDDSTVWAWGRNKCGVLGNGTYIDNPVPSRIDTLKEIVAISADGGRCLALRKDGTVWFWGLVHVDFDQGLEVLQNKPIQIEGLENVTMIYASPVLPLLFMKDDGSYWSYDVWTKELRRIQL